MSYFSPNCKIYEFLHIFSFHFVYRLFRTHTLVSAFFLSPFARGQIGYSAASAKDISSSTCVVVVLLKKERDRELKPANERSMCISSP